MATPELGARLSRSEIHVDPSRPSELADPSVALEIMTFDEPRTIVVASASARRDGGPTFGLDLALEAGEVTVPPHEIEELVLVNRTQANAELASQCQTVLSLRLELQVPNRPELGMALDDDLTVFCP